MVRDIVFVKILFSEKNYFSPRVKGDKKKGVGTKNIKEIKKKNIGFNSKLKYIENFCS